MELENEARKFKESRTMTMTKEDKTAFRYYFGCAITGKLAHEGRPRGFEINDMLIDCADIAIAAIEKEKEAT